MIFRRSKWVENSYMYVEECSFRRTSPKAISSNIKASSIVSVGRGQMHCLISDRLEIRLDGDISADLCEKDGDDISDLIVLETTFGTR